MLLSAAAPASTTLLTTRQCSLLTTPCTAQAPGTTLPVQHWYRGPAMQLRAQPSRASVVSDCQATSAQGREHLHRGQAVGGSSAGPHIGMLAAAILSGAFPLPPPVWGDLARPRSSNPPASKSCIRRPHMRYLPNHRHRALSSLNPSKMHQHGVKMLSGASQWAPPLLALTSGILAAAIL